MTAETTSLLDAARALAPQIRTCRDEIERERRLPASLVGAIAEAGLFRMWVPRSLGGGEVEPETLIEVVEEVARVDGAAGWCVMIAAGTGLVGGLLREDAGRTVFGHPLVATGGAIAPMGKAAVVEGGYRVTGRWPFGSGSPHCDWLVGNCVVFEGDAPRMIAEGVPETRVMLLQRGRFEIIDTWHTAGLRGTGSHDFAVRDLFVPAELSLSFAEPPGQPGPLYRIPIFGLLALSVAAVPLGIARGAIDSFVALAGAKTPAMGRGILAERPVVQLHVAQAEALLRSARALLYETARDTWATVAGGGALTLEQRALVRLASTNATTASAQAVDLMYHAGGGSSVYATSPLERAFRDIHTATQHALVGQSTWETAGRVFLGQKVSTAAL
jgi:indole-3-acetate monooxygenase